MSHVSDPDYQSVCFESQILDRQQVFLPLKMWSYCILILQGAQKVQLTTDDHSSLILFSLNVHQKRPSMANGVVLYLLVLTNRSKSKDVFSDQDDIFPLEIYVNLPTTGMLRYLNIYLIAAMTCQLDNREKCFKYGIQPLSDLRVSQDKMTFRFFVCVR